MAVDPHALSETIEELLERMAFLFLDPAEEDDFDDFDGPMSHARVAFSGEMQGSLDVYMADEKAAELAANMLGEDDADDIGEEERADALRELANVICGHAITVTGGEMVSCEISPPVVQPADDERVAAARDSEDIIVFNCDDTPLMVHFVVQ